MNKYFKWIILIVIWNSILFFDKEFGLSVILFIIPLLFFIYYILKENKRIKNKYGLLFIIPIILLSLSYCIFNNDFFQLLNIPVIIGLFLLLYIFTIKPTFKIPTIFNDMITLIVEPFNNFSNIFNLLKKQFTGNFKISSDSKKKILSFLIVLPIVIFIIILLSSADLVFSNIFSGILNMFNNISIPDVIPSFIHRLIIMIILFLYISATINFLLFNFSKIKYREDTFKIDDYTTKLLLTILNVVYIVFDIIQIKSLLLHKVSMNISYAEYARQGFFQLMFVSFINLTIILLSKKYERKSNKSSKQYISIMSFIMIGLTLIIVVSSFIRMYMYESAYGLTLLRLLVYISLITEVILFIPTIFYILDSKFKITKYYLIILISVYTVLNFINIDYIIATRNIKHYYETGKIDIDYLENYNTDNIKVLVKFYENTTNNELKESLKGYFSYINTNTKGFQEFNISKMNAERILYKYK